MREIGNKIRGMVKAYINAQMENNMREIGKKVRCMVKAYLNS